MNLSENITLMCTHHWEPLFPHKLSTQMKHKTSQFWNNFGFLNKFTLYDLSSNNFDSSNHISILYFVGNISHLLFIYMSPWNL